MNTINALLDYVTKKDVAIISLATLISFALMFALGLNQVGAFGVDAVINRISTAMLQSAMFGFLFSIFYFSTKKYDDDFCVEYEEEPIFDAYNKYYDKDYRHYYN